MTDKRTEYRPSDDFDLEFEVLEASAKNRAQREMRIVIMITPIVAVAASGAAVYGIPTLFSALAPLKQRPENSSMKTGRYEACAVS